MSDHANKASIEVTRESASHVNETLEVLVESIQTSDVYLKNFLMSIGSGGGVVGGGGVVVVNDVINEHGGGKSTVGGASNYMGKNVTLALPNLDFEPIKKIVKFMPGEVSKKFHVNIFADSSSSSSARVSTDSLKIFTIQLKPINLIGSSSSSSRFASSQNLTQCSYINPDFVNIVIEQSFDKSMRIDLFLFYSILFLISILN